jgi:uncharacterized protein involved in exopolysaccharide biosynthesis
LERAVPTLLLLALLLAPGCAARRAERGIGRTNTALERANATLDRVEARLASLDRHLERLATVDASLERIDEHMASLRETLEGLALALLAAGRASPPAGGAGGD